MAYKMLENEEYPSWLYEINHGATTIWEDWEGKNSRNHYSNGACCDWIFRTVCGISIIDENLFRIAPVPGGKLTEASLDYRSVYGEVSCKWEKTKDKVTYTVKIPPGCKAEVQLEDGGIQTKEAGKYVFEFKNVLS